MTTSPSHVTSHSRPPAIPSDLSSRKTSFMKLFILLADLNDADSQASMQKLKNQIHTSADFRSVPDFIRKIDAILSAYLSRDPSAPSKLEKFLTDFPLWDENRKIQRDPSESPRKPL